MRGMDLCDWRAPRPRPNSLNSEAAMSGIGSMVVLAFGPLEITALAFVVLLLFGNRLPSVMRSLGVGITEFKKGIRGDGLTEPDAAIEDKRQVEK
jgi:sec-independent protein translocase protein TatA